MTLCVNITLCCSTVCYISTIYGFRYASACRNRSSTCRHERITAPALCTDHLGNVVLSTWLFQLFISALQGLYAALRRKQSVGKEREDVIDSFSSIFVLPVVLSTPSATEPAQTGCRQPADALFRVDNRKLRPQRPRLQRFCASRQPEPSALSVAAVTGVTCRRRAMHRGRRYRNSQPPVRRHVVQNAILQSSLSVVDVRTQYDVI